MVRVFIVLPDVSTAKVNAILRASRERGPVDVLVSYTTLTWKPSSYGRLLLLREHGALGEVMLDSGAYHLMRLGMEVPLEDYAARAVEGPWDLVVAPDVPSDPGLTIERSVRFTQLHPGEFIPVLQGETVEGYLASLRAEWELGLLDRAPMRSGARLVGVGGLDGPRRRIAFLSRLVSSVLRESRSIGLDIVLHLFGIGVRLIRGLRRRGLLESVYSVDSSGWLAEITFRRRTVYAAHTPEEASYKAITAYLAKAEAASTG